MPHQFKPSIYRCISWSILNLLTRNFQQQSHHQTTWNARKGRTSYLNEGTWTWSPYLFLPFASASSKLVVDFELVIPSTCKNFSIYFFWRKSATSHHSRFFHIFSIGEKTETFFNYVLLIFFYVIWNIFSVTISFSSQTLSFLNSHIRLKMLDKNII